MFHSFCCLRLSVLLLGCGTAGQTVHISHVSHVNDATPSLRQEESTPSQQRLKGTRSHTARESREQTDAKMSKWNVDAEKVMDVAKLVEKAAAENNLPASLIYGVIWVESRFNPRAKSGVGARGLMQLMPKTAKYLAEKIGWKGRADSYDPEFNIAAGSYYVARLIKQFDGDIDLALAAYNAGPGNIRKWMKNTGLPPVSIEYYTMVKTAQRYFGPVQQESSPLDHEIADPLPTTDDLDKLGLAVLIAGLSDAEFGLDRTDSANPFN